MKNLNFLALFLANVLAAQSISLVKDINPGIQGSSPRYFTNLNQKIYFSATNAATGIELWETNGTGEGTQLVADYIPGEDGQIPVNLIAFNNKVYYSSLLGIDGKPSGLYKYDPANGIQLVSEDYSWTSDFYATPNALYFNAGNMLYAMKKDESIAKISETIAPNGQAAEINGKLLFGGRPIADEENYFFQFYSYDGTETKLVKTLHPTSTGNPQNFFYSPTLNNVLFNGTDATTASVLWISDGTEEGTYRLKDINSESEYSSSYPSGFVQIGDKIVFSATDYTNGGTELYVTDGTEAGTKLLKDVYPGSGSSYPSKLTYLNGKVYFFAENSDNEAQIWETDGTEAGTKLTLRLKPGTTNFYLQEMIAYENNLLISAKFGVTPGQELYKVTMGTLSVDQANVSKSSVYPNPTTGDVFVKPLVKGNFELYDFSGKMVQKGKIGNDSKISLTAQPGIYQLKTTSENGLEITINKIIIK